MRRFFIGFSFMAASVLIVLMSGCKDNSSSPTAPSYNTPSMNTSTNTNTVTIVGYSFSPGIDTIAVNSTVTWNNTSGVAHTSTSDSGLWDTGNIPAGSSKTTVFTSIGTFHYHCTYHSGMVGTITVR